MRASRILRTMGAIWSLIATPVMNRFDRSVGLGDDDHPDSARERGGATVEFVILLPLFLGIFLASFETSMLMTRQVMLERGVDMATRDIRLDGVGSISQDELRDEICARARILPNCQSNLLVELTQINVATMAMPTSDTPCQDFSVAGTETAAFISNRAEKLILMRACYSVDPIIPFGLGADLVNDIDGTIRMVTSTAFIVEPV
ncbi:TadE/TadG family type IV pilus assembly protein [Jannaschia sp. KMU-145]|uniref:TadE/TadG family type IV pilus assembly protein n=1 Tax=Jannaschia halovivens TaxID=3388667 RepID=UPI00396B46D8